MPDSQNHKPTVPSDQQAIRDKCFHPSETFVELPMENAETSILTQFNTILVKFLYNIAVKTEKRAITIMTSSIRGTPEEGAQRALIAERRDEYEVR